MWCATNKSSSKSRENLEEKVDQIEFLIDYFNTEWNDLSICNEPSLSVVACAGSNLNTLILNSCFIDLRIVECLLEKLKNLKELHLSSNNYSTINFSSGFSQPSIKILYFNNNNLENWTDVCKLGECFSSLEHFMISENKINDFGHSSFRENPHGFFKNVQILVMNKFNIQDWDCVNFEEFPQLKHIRIQNIPLLDKYTKEEKYDLLVGHLNEKIETLNGGNISKDEKKICELKYLSHFAELNDKPKRYCELEFKHRKSRRIYKSGEQEDKRILLRIEFKRKYFYEKLCLEDNEFVNRMEQIAGCIISELR